MFAFRQDGSFWFASNSFRSSTLNADLYSRTGKYIESFRVVLTAIITSMAATASEIALCQPGLIRAGHVFKGDFTVDREWNVRGRYRVYPLHNDHFAMVNPQSGAFGILDPRTPLVAQVTPEIAPDLGPIELVSTADDSLWYLMRGDSGSLHELVRIGQRGAVVSRINIELPPNMVPKRMAIAGRSLYIVGPTAVVVRYDLPAESTAGPSGPAL